MGGCNRYLQQFQYTYERDTVTIFGAANVGAAGAVASDGFGGAGVQSVTKLGGTGQYEVQLEDRFASLLDARAYVVGAAASAILGVQLLQDPATLQADFQADGKLTFVALNAAGAAANPADGEQIKFVIIARKSTVKPNYLDF